MVSDYEFALPRWELSDPFGRNALKGMRYELKRALCDRDSYKARLECVLTEQGNAVNMMANALAHEQALTQELDRRLRVCDEARKSLGEKNNAILSENTALKAKNAELAEELARLRYEYAELTAQHEKLVRGMTDKEVEA